jgi:hypothetical protein
MGERVVRRVSFLTKSLIGAGCIVRLLMEFELDGEDMSLYVVGSLRKASPLCWMRLIIAGLFQLLLQLTDPPLQIFLAPANGLILFLQTSFRLACHHIDQFELVDPSFELGVRHEQLVVSLWRF